MNQVTLSFEEQKKIYLECNQILLDNLGKKCSLTFGITWIFVLASIGITLTSSTTEEQKQWVTQSILLCTPIICLYALWIAIYFMKNHLLKQNEYDLLHATCINKSIEHFGRFESSYLKIQIEGKEETEELCVSDAIFNEIIPGEPLYVVSLHLDKISLLKRLSFSGIELICHRI